MKMEFEEEGGDIAVETEAVLKQWSEALEQTTKSIEGIENCNSASALPRLNALAHDSLLAMRAAELELDLLAPQQPSPQQIESCLCTLRLWKNHYDEMHSMLRAANLKAKANIQKAVQQERELLLGGGEESTIRRRNLQTKADMTAAAESITESLRRTRQLMVQEVERSAATLTTLDFSSSTLKKAESEYEGHGKLLTGSRRLLRVMRRRDVLDRILLTVGFIFFCMVVLYIISKRIGLLNLQRRLFSSLSKDSSTILPTYDYAKPTQAMNNANNEVITAGLPGGDLADERFAEAPSYEETKLRIVYNDICFKKEGGNEKCICPISNDKYLLQTLLRTEDHYCLVF